MSKKFLHELTSYSLSKAFIFIHNTSWLERVDQARQHEAVVLGRGGCTQRSRQVMQGSKSTVVVYTTFAGASMNTMLSSPI